MKINGSGGKVYMADGDDWVPIAEDCQVPQKFFNGTGTFSTASAELVEISSPAGNLEVTVSSGEQFYQRNKHGGFVPCAPDTPGALNFSAVLAEAATAVAGLAKSAAAFGLAGEDSFAKFAEALNRLPPMDAEPSQEPEPPLPARAFDWGKR